MAFTLLTQLLGISVSRHEFICPILVDIGKNLFNLHIFTFAVGDVAFGIIHGIIKFRPYFPAGLPALVVTTGAVWLIQLTSQEEIDAKKIQLAFNALQLRKRPYYFLPPNMVQKPYLVYSKLPFSMSIRRTHIKI